MESGEGSWQERALEDLGKQIHGHLREHLRVVAGRKRDASAGIPHYVRYIISFAFLPEDC